MRGLVGIYYTVLRTVVRNKPHLRRYLVRCRHCWIFFITDPRNAGREDLGCPFGCAELHRRKESDKRSAEYNGSPLGKWKRHQREAERREAEERSAAEGSKPAAAESAAPADAAHSAVSGSTESPAEDHGGDSPRSSRGPAAAERIEIAPGMVRYIRCVVSLIEDRAVGLQEVLAMLQRTRRQHSFAWEKRIHYVLRSLKEKPPQGAAMAQELELSQSDRRYETFGIKNPALEAGRFVPRAERVMEESLQSGARSPAVTLHRSIERRGS